MEDFLIREIDRLGEMLLMIARKLGLLDGDERLAYQMPVS